MVGSLNILLLLQHARTHTHIHTHTHTHTIPESSSSSLPLLSSMFSSRCCVGETAALIARADVQKVSLWETATYKSRYREEMVGVSGENSRGEQRGRLADLYVLG